MDSLLLWQLFLKTGLPEAYSLYCLLRKEEPAGLPAEGEKTA